MLTLYKINFKGSLYPNFDELETNPDYYIGKKSIPLSLGEPNISIYHIPSKQMIATFIATPHDGEISIITSIEPKEMLRFFSKNNVLEVNDLQKIALEINKANELISNKTLSNSLISLDNIQIFDFFVRKSCYRNTEQFKLLPIFLDFSYDIDIKIESQYSNYMNNYIYNIINLINILNKFCDVNKLELDAEKINIIKQRSAVYNGPFEKPTYTLNNLFHDLQYSFIETKLISKDYLNESVIKDLISHTAIETLIKIFQRAKNILDISFGGAKNKFIIDKESFAILCKNPDLTEKLFALMHSNCSSSNSPFTYFSKNTFRILLQYGANSLDYIFKTLVLLERSGIPVCNYEVELGDFKDKFIVLNHVLEILSNNLLNKENLEKILANPDKLYIINNIIYTCKMANILNQETFNQACDLYISNEYAQITKHSFSFLIDKMDLFEYNQLIYSINFPIAYNMMALLHLLKSNNILYEGLIEDIHKINPTKLCETVSILGMLITKYNLTSKDILQALFKIKSHNELIRLYHHLQCDFSNVVSELDIDEVVKLFNASEYSYDLFYFLELLNKHKALTFQAKKFAFENPDKIDRLNSAILSLPYSTKSNNDVFTSLINTTVDYYGNKNYETFEYEINDLLYFFSRQSKNVRGDYLYSLGGRSVRIEKNQFVINLNEDNHYVIINRVLTINEVKILDRILKYFPITNNKDWPSKFLDLKLDDYPGDLLNIAANAFDSYGNNIIGMACHSQCQVEIIQKLIDIGAKLNTADHKDGRLALFWAIVRFGNTTDLKNSTSILKCLLYNGASIDITGYFNMTALELAKHRDYKAVTRIIEEVIFRNSSYIKAATVSLFEDKIPYEISSLIALYLNIEDGVSIASTSKDIRLLTKKNVEYFIEKDVESLTV